MIDMRGKIWDLESTLVNTNLVKSTSRGPDFYQNDQWGRFLLKRFKDCSGVWKHQWQSSAVLRRAVNKYSKFKYIFEYQKKKRDSIVKINIPLWKKTHQWLLCKWAHSMTGQGQVTGVALVPRHSLLKVRRDMVWTPSNLKSPVWKYFGFWSVDSKNVVPRDKVVCKLCKLQLA